MLRFRDRFAGGLAVDRDRVTMGRVVSRHAPVIWAAAFVAVATPAEAQDRFFAPDKGLHFGVSFALTASGYGASALVFEDRTISMVTGATLGLGLGIAKEGYDAVAGSGWSWNDLAWDAIGVGSGLAFAWLLDRLLSGPALASAAGPSRRPARALRDAGNGRHPPGLEPPQGWRAYLALRALWFGPAATDRRAHRGQVRKSRPPVRIAGASRPVH